MDPQPGQGVMGGEENRCQEQPLCKVWLYPHGSNCRAADPFIPRARDWLGSLLTTWYGIVCSSLGVTMGTFQTAQWRELLGLNKPGDERKRPLCFLNRCPGAPLYFCPSLNQGTGFLWKCKSSAAV